MDGQLDGLNHFGMEVSEVRSSSVATTYRDRCHVGVPYCGDKLHIDVLLNEGQPEVPPDFVLPEDESGDCIIDLEALPPYDPSDSFSLARILKSVTSSYAKSQAAAAIEAARCNPELLFSIESHLAHVEGVQFCVLPGERGKVRCSLPVEVEDPEDCMPRKRARLRLVVLFDARKAGAPEVSLRGGEGGEGAPEGVPEWASEVAVPSWPAGQASMEYVARLQEALGKAAAAARAQVEHNRTVVQSLVACLPCSALLDHCPRWSRAALLASRTPAGTKEGLYFIVILQFGAKFPAAEGPAVTVVAAGNKMLPGTGARAIPRPAQRAYAAKETPFSPRWSASILANRLGTWLEATAIPQAARAYSEGEA